MYIMVTKLLTEAKIKSFRLDKDLQEKLLSDGEGLNLRAARSQRITNQVNLSWIFRHTHPVTKKPTRLGLGKYPQISLAEARELAEAQRKKILTGENPIQESLSLRQALNIWLEKKKVGTGSISFYSLNWVRRLRCLFH